MFQDSQYFRKNAKLLGGVEYSYVILLGELILAVHKLKKKKEVKLLYCFFIHILLLFRRQEMWLHSE